MPEAIFIEIAAALAAKTAESVYEFVRERFKNHRRALEKLKSVDGTAKDSPEVITLAQELEATAALDKAFGTELQARWAALQSGTASDGGVVNLNTGTVSGNLIQARDIHGGITFGKQ